VSEFGEPTDIDDLITKSELYQALATSFNMEFCRSNKFRNSGLLIWQYDDIWPCMSWSMVDWYGTPKASYYFMKRASQLVHISADYERYLWRAGETFAADVHLLNDSDAPVKNCTFDIRLLDVSGKTLAQQSGPAQTEANQSSKVGRIEYKIPPEMAGRIMFVVVELTGKDDVKLSTAVYPIAVSKTGDVQDYRDIFAEMNAMRPAAIKAELVGTVARFDRAKNGTLGVRVSNPTDRLAFFIRVRLIEESEVITTGYDDNYFSLLPGESRSLNVTIENKVTETALQKLHFEISGWKTPAQTLEVNVAH
jgi:beta-mannosidase